MIPIIDHLNYAHCKVVLILQCICYLKCFRPIEIHEDISSNFEVMLQIHDKDDLVQIEFQ